jgi:cell fate (sporulation/competence/biofilm development) regulator YlbF (YheA/YmcA/DUF963 family)
LNTEQRKELNGKQSRTKDEQTPMKIEQQQNKLNSNNKIVHDITRTQALCTT